jgi:Mg-chelatase subunit ChlD
MAAQARQPEPAAIEQQQLEGLSLPFIPGLHGRTGYRLIYVVDVSGSMGDAGLLGQSKLDNAKTFLQLHATLMSPFILRRTGLIAHDDDADVVVQPRHFLSGPGMLMAAIQLALGGGTDIPGALVTTGEVIDQLPLSKIALTRVIWISDGMSTSGDPCPKVKELRKQGYRFTSPPMGFDLQGEGARQLQCMATATNGSYKLIPLDLADLLPFDLPF